METLSLEDWGNSATPYTVPVLYEFNQMNFHPRKKDIHSVIQNRLDEPPSYHTVARSIDALIKESYVEVVPDTQGAPLRLTDKGYDIVDEDVDPFS